MTVLAATPGNHPLTSVCGDQYLSLLVLKFYYCAFTLDSLVSSLIAAVITVAIGLLVAARVRSGVPGKLQMVLEFFLGYVRGLVRESVAENAGFILPLAATLGMYIAIANWIDFFPLGFSPLIEPANSDLNQTLAMAVLVFLLVQAYSVRVLGLRGYLRRFTKPFELNWVVRAAFIPLNVIEEIVKPVTLSLRLFGNLFAGLLMVYLLTLLPFFVAWFPVAAWKFFDVFFVGTIQAFIFMLLTIIYFGMAREGLEEELHARAADRHPDDAATAAITQ
ncbi:MAG TPA: FoF1 ATP synthase subunit a [Candidatus Dormibacteraeota bacterium]|nr:FoF1 ATP synthase subunit a [Candidatus Dormibacteraeota bacterium]